MGTLYIVGAPTGDPDDLTLRAKRILGEAALVASDHPGVQQLLAYHTIAVPYLSFSDLAQAAAINRILGSLENADVAILCTGDFIGPTGPSRAAIYAALEYDFPVVPVPGPTLPLTALVVSGLPADSFVYLGQLPRQPATRRKLLVSMAAQGRTLVVLESPEHVLGLLSELHETLGDRPLAVTSSDLHPAGTWRGTIDKASEYLSEQPAEVPLVLVIGGARENAEPWDGKRLKAEVQTRLEQGLGAKETSRQLAVESGWPRREIYRLAVEAGESPAVV